MLLDLEQQIVTTIGNLSGFKKFTPSLVARARSDRELRDRARLGITARPG